MARSPMQMSVEIVLDEYGRWCPTCLLPSGVRRTLACHGGGRLALRAGAICLDCGRVLDAAT